MGDTRSICTETGCTPQYRWTLRRQVFTRVGLLLRVRKEKQNKSRPENRTSQFWEAAPQIQIATLLKPTVVARVKRRLAIQRHIKMRMSHRLRCKKPTPAIVVHLQIKQKIVCLGNLSLPPAPVTIVTSRRIIITLCGALDLLRQWLRLPWVVSQAGHL